MKVKKFAILGIITTILIAPYTAFAAEKDVDFEKK